MRDVRVPIYPRVLPRVCLIIVMLATLDAAPPLLADDVVAPATITQEQAKQQADAAREVLNKMGFLMAYPPVWYPNPTLPRWELACQFKDRAALEQGEENWQVTVMVCLSVEAAKRTYDGVLSMSQGAEKAWPPFMATADGAGHVPDDWSIAWFRCENVQVTLNWQKGVPAGTKVEGAYTQEGRAACKQMAVRVHDAFAEGGVCSPAAAPARELDAPIPSAAIDRYLDLLAAKITAARDQASAPTLDPLAFTTGQFSYEQAAYMATTVWLECQGLIKAHIDRRLLLNEAQKQRVKAFGWWVDWIVQRTAHPWVVRSQPPYPLFGNIDQRVPTPPQYKGEDIMMVNFPYWGWDAGEVKWVNDAITDDHLWAATETALRLGDIYYAGGLLYTAQLVLTSDDYWQVGMAVMSSLPHIGKWVSAVMSTAIEANAIYHIGADGVNPLTWNEHVANICAITNLGLQGVVSFRANATRANAAAGIDDGFVPPEVSEKYGGKSFKLSDRQTKQLPGGEKLEVAQADYAVVGAYKGKTAPGFVSHERRPVAIRKDAQGNERYFELEGDKLGDPIFFLGEKGYHIWSHLTEIKSGHETGFTSVKKLMDDRADYAATLKGIEKTMRDPNGNLKQAEGSYVGFVNKLIEDGSYEKMQGFYQYTKQGATPGAPRQSVGNVEANTFVRVPRPTTDPSQVSHYPVRISIDPSTGKLMNVFVVENTRPGDQYMSNMLAETLKKRFYAWNTNDKVIFACPEFKTVAAALGLQ